MKKSKRNIDLLWPSIFLIPILILTIFLMSKDLLLAILLIAVDIIYFVGLVILYFKRNNIEKDINSEKMMISGYVQSTVYNNLIVPCIITDINGSILNMNISSMKLFGKNTNYKKNISNLLEDKITSIDFPDKLDVMIEKYINFDTKYYKIKFTKVNAEHFGEIVIIYFIDETQINTLRKENAAQRLVQGLIYIDNYDEVLQSLDDVRRALLIGLIERKIKRYFVDMNGIIQGIDKDKYRVLIQYKYLDKLQSQKFNILEDVKNVKIGESIPMTLSIGFGDYSSNYQESYESAVAAVDLALARGGDQAVVKKGENVYYYGGRSKTVERNTRVKARVKANALKAVFESRNKVLIMGHKLADIDCVGAGIGVYTIASMMGNEAHIVLDEVINSVKTSINKFFDEEKYKADMFISSDVAREYIDKDTTLVIVDVNNPSYTENPDLIDKAGQVVVIDHHRQGDVGIKNPVLSYIEPYASSTCEMITEILQYVTTTKLKLDVNVVNALYSGILIDTNYFSNKVGVRTFEAAAFLRKNGADLDGIRKMLRDDMERIKAKAEVISNAEEFNGEYMIGTLLGDGLLSPTELGAQAANELLNIEGVKASFVLTKIEDIIFISARSIDEINVQIIMERLGGGGHQTVAGAQLEGISLTEAKIQLMDLVEKMTIEGDL